MTGQHITMNDGAKIYTNVEGNANDRPIVLVHGYAFNSDMWRYQVPYLTERDYQVVTLDLRGFGKSDKPVAPPQAKYDYDRWALDLDTVIQTLNRNDIRLVGYSMGGAVAMYYASKTPNPPLKKLTLLAATGPWMTRTLTHQAGRWKWEYDWAIWLIEQGQRSMLPSSWFHQAFQFLTKISYQSLTAPMVKWISDMVDSASPQALIGGLEQFANQNLTTRLGNIHTRAKIIRGDYDPFVDGGVRDEQLNGIAGAIKPDFDFNLSGHLLFFEEKEKTNCEIAW
ncbi:MAG: alpha/beta fold hydrolase [Halobacteriota archaeon]